MVHNLSVKSKLAYVFSVLTVMVVCISINSIYALNQSRQAFESYLEVLMRAQTLPHNYARRSTDAPSPRAILC